MATTLLAICHDNVSYNQNYKVLYEQSYEALKKLSIATNSIDMAEVFCNRYKFRRTK